MSRKPHAADRSGPVHVLAANNELARPLGLREAPKNDVRQTRRDLEQGGEVVDQGLPQCPQALQLLTFRRVFLRTGEKRELRRWVIGVSCRFGCDIGLAEHLEKIRPGICGAVPGRERADFVHCVLWLLAEQDLQLGRERAGAVAVPHLQTEVQELLQAMGMEHRQAQERNQKRYRRTLQTFEHQHPLQADH
jgi:hypothetical protein